MERLVFKEAVVLHRWGSETLKLRQSYDFKRAYSLFVARGASFVSHKINYMPDIIINANDQIVV